MTAPQAGLTYVRAADEPALPPPAGEGTILSWVGSRLFGSIGNTILTIVAIAFVVLIVPPIVRWAIIDAVWTGQDREACLAPGAGACWAFVKAKFAQFMYGRYPVPERWRVDLTGLLLIAGLVPMAIPRAPFKRETIVYLLVIFPLVALVLLTGGNFAISFKIIPAMLILGAFATGIVALGITGDGRAAATARTLVPMAIVAAVVVFGASFLYEPYTVSLGRWALPGSTVLIAALAIGVFAMGVAAILAGRGLAGLRSLWSPWAGVGAVLIVAWLLSRDFGLPYIETSLWGGLLVTLVVAIVGIVASMPLGILLALGRRSRLPVIRFVSVVFIEFVRGVPLITVLFMASVMLPLFLPPGVNFDKFLRALIGVALFSAAYMAEVVRGGLQAIPKGQYEAAQALGLNYWRSMGLIVLPQALKIVIPGIVNSFISLFKDTSLVSIIGIYDLLGIISQNFSDANWFSPNTPATGYIFAAVVFWIFCFSMSRYSIYTERRLDTGHRR